MKVLDNVPCIEKVYIERTRVVNYIKCGSLGFVVYISSSRRTVRLHGVYERFLSKKPCCGSGSAWIRILKVLLDPDTDPGGNKMYRFMR